MMLDYSSDSHWAIERMGGGAGNYRSNMLRVHDTDSIVTCSTPKEPCLQNAFREFPSDNMSFQFS
jgi:hypothetical protein